MKVTFVYRGFGHSARESSHPGHPAHYGFQQAIGADSFVFTGIESRLDATFLGDVVQAVTADFPVTETYVLENVNALYAAPFIRHVNPDATIILLAAHGIFGLESYNFAGDSQPKATIRRIERWVNHRSIRHLCNRVDGILTISEYVGAYLDRRITTPTLPVYPYIQPQLYEILQTLGNNRTRRARVITVCESRDHKGIDLLVEAWPLIRRTRPDAELHIIGEGHPDRYEQTDGVYVRGFVDDLISEYAKADIYVHPARRDAFGVSVVEAMLAGVIPVVTETTGAREEVECLSPRLLTEPTVDAIGEGVLTTLQATEDNRTTWREQARARASRYSEAEKTAEFTQQFERLLSGIR